MAFLVSSVFTTTLITNTTFTFSIDDNVVAIHKELINTSLTKDAVAIVISDRLKDAIKYISHTYKSLDIKFKIYTLSKVLIMFPRGNEYESLRAFARYVRNVLKFKYLLLIGDDVSTAYYYMKDSLSGIEGALKATDMYYSLLDGLWDYDGDGRLLESGTRGNSTSCIVMERLPDITPDLIVGRLPFDSVYEVKEYYEDILRYVGRYEPVFRVLLLASMIHLPGEGNVNYTIDGASILNRLYLTYFKDRNNLIALQVYDISSLGSGKYHYDAPLTRNTLREMLSNSTFNLVIMVMHGNGARLVRKIWIRDNGDSIAEPDEIAYIPILSYDDVPQLKGMPVIYIESCLVNAFDILGRYSLGRALITKGALAVIAPSRAIFYKLSNVYESPILTYFTKYLIEDYPLVRPSTAFYKAISEFLHRNINLMWRCSYLKDALSYMFFGDPIIADKFFLFKLIHMYSNRHYYNPI